MKKRHLIFAGLALSAAMTTPLPAAAMTAGPMVLDFSNMDTAPESTVIDYMEWVQWQHDSGGGHLYFETPTASQGYYSAIYFSAPVNVISADFNGLPYGDGAFNPDFNSNQLTVTAYGPGSDYDEGSGDWAGEVIGSATFDLAGLNSSKMNIWLHAAPDTPWPGVGVLVFTTDKDSYPSIDNLTVSPVPVPGALWLLGSGLAGLLVFRKKEA